MQAIIDGTLYEVSPEIKVIIDRLKIENAELKQRENELKRENARLEKGYQKSVGVIAADRLPTKVDLYKIKMMCEDTDCENCQYREGSFCLFSLGVCPLEWDFGGAK